MTKFLASLSSSIQLVTGRRKFLFEFIHATMLEKIDAILLIEISDAWDLLMFPRRLSFSWMALSSVKTSFRLYEGRILICMHAKFAYWITSIVEIYFLNLHLSNKPFDCRDWWWVGFEFIKIDNEVPRCFSYPTCWPWSIQHLLPFTILQQRHLLYTMLFALFVSFWERAGSTSSSSKCYEFSFVNYSAEFPLTMKTNIF